MLGKDSGDGNSYWRAHGRSQRPKEITNPQAVEVKLEPVDIESVLVALSLLPISAMLSFYKQLCLIRDDKTVIISEAGTPQLWSILDLLGSLPDYPAIEDTGSRAKKPKPREVCLPDKNRGWSKVHVVQIIASIDADPGLSAKIKEARLNKQKQKGGGRSAVTGPEDVGAVEVAPDVIALVYGGDQADEVTIFQGSEQLAEAAPVGVATGFDAIAAPLVEVVRREVTHGLYDQEKLDGWRRSLGVLIKQWNVFLWSLNDQLAFLLEDDLLERFVAVAAQSNLMRVEIYKLRQEFVIIWIDNYDYWEGKPRPKKLPQVNKEAGIEKVVNDFISSLSQPTEPDAEETLPATAN